MAAYYKAGKVQALAGAPEITAETFGECDHIVALSGAEPFQKALEMGADIIVCGRSTDTAIMAFYPLLKGCHEASCWHAAKIAECGGLCTSAGLQAAPSWNWMTRLHRPGHCSWSHGNALLRFRPFAV